LPGAKVGKDDIVEEGKIIFGEDMILKGAASQ